MIIITPETIINKKSNKLNTKSVFLAGTIDNGNSKDWQKEVIDILEKENISLEIYNPRREHWNPNPSKEEMEYQIKWEQDHLDKATIIVMVLSDNSKSPISLLELGLYATSGKLIVFCTDNFYRYDNVRLTCEKYNIELIEDTDSKVIGSKIISQLL